MKAVLLTYFLHDNINDIVRQEIEQYKEINFLKFIRAK